MRGSSLDVVPKKSLGEFRLIHHLSSLADQSSLFINSGIAVELTSVHYTSFDVAVTTVVRVGSGSLLGESDIKYAFRLLLIFPGDFDLLVGILDWHVPASI